MHPNGNRGQRSTRPGQHINDLQTIYRGQHINMGYDLGICTRNKDRQSRSATPCCPGPSVAPGGGVSRRDTPGDTARDGGQPSEGQGTRSQSYPARGGPGGWVERVAPLGSVAIANGPPCRGPTPRRCGSPVTPPIKL